MKIVSWNVNGIRARIDHIVAWIEENQPDVLALQETKVMDELFPHEPFEAMSYVVETFGQKSYNGVANITKNPSEHTSKGITGFDDPQTRVISTTHDGIRVVNVYVPNGQAVGTEKFLYKLEWLNHLKIMLDNDLKEYPKMVVLGDFILHQAMRIFMIPMSGRIKFYAATKSVQPLRKSCLWAFMTVSASLKKGLAFTVGGTTGLPHIEEGWV